MKHLGTLFLSIWLILTGLMGIARLSFRYDDVIMGVLAIVVGALLFARRL